MVQRKILTPKLEERFKQTEEIISDFDRLAHVLTQQDTRIEIIEDKKPPNPKGDKYTTIKIKEEGVIIMAVTNDKKDVLGIRVTFPSQISFLLNRDPTNKTLFWEKESEDIDRRLNDKIASEKAPQKEEEIKDIDRLLKLLNEDEDMAGRNVLDDLERRLKELNQPESHSPKKQDDTKEEVLNEYSDLEKELGVDDLEQRLNKLQEDSGDDMSSPKDEEPSLLSKKENPTKKSESYEEPVFDEAFVEKFKQADKDLEETLSKGSVLSKQDIKAEARKVYQEIYGEEAPEENKPYDLDKGAFKQMQLRYFIEDIRTLCNEKPQKIDNKKKPGLLQSNSKISIISPALSV